MQHHHYHVSNFLKFMVVLMTGTLVYLAFKLSKG